MKALAAALVLAAAVSAPADDLSSMGVRIAAAIKSRPNRVPLPQETRDKPLPPPKRQRGEELKVLKADTYSDQGGKIAASGGVEITYRGYDIQAERVLGDRQTEVFLLDGKAVLVGEDAEIKGEQIEVDFKRNVFRFKDAKATLGPSQIGNDVRSDVFVFGDGGLGTSKEIRTDHGGITTCNLEKPHFRLLSSDTLIVPEKYAKLRDVKLELFGATILSWPLLIIPLTRDAQRYMPEFGESPDEGKYLKMKFGTPLRGDDYLDHRLDLMEKKGVGIGTDWVYDVNRLMSGRATSYFLMGPEKSTQLGIDHRQSLGSAEISLSGQYQENNYLTAPKNTLLNSRGQVVLPWGGGQSRLSYQRTSSASSGFESISDGWSFADTRRIGKSFSTNLELNLSENQTKGVSGFGSDSQRLDVRLNTDGDFRSFTGNLLYQRSIPVKGDNRFLGTSDRTPLVTLKSSSEKLFGRKGSRLLPFNFETSVGELFDPSTEGGITRITFQGDVRQTVGRGPLTLDVGSRFQQGMYSDDTAQYILSYDSTLRYGFARDSSFNINYRNLRGFGYTPLSIDRTGRNDFFSADVTYKPLRSLLLSGSTGYDVLQSSRGFTPWQSVSLRAEWNPTDTARYRLSSYYDTYSLLWSSFQLDADFMVQGARFVLGARYDGRREKIANASLTAANMRWGRLTTSVLLDWNGFTEQLEALQYQVVYDLHCTEAVLEVIDNRVGFRSGSQIGFYIRLKAFPSFSPFGFGRRGQAVGSGGGLGFGG